MIDILSYECQN